MPGIATASPAKKPRLEEKPKNTKAFSSLLKKVSGSTPEKGGFSIGGTPSKSPGAKGNSNDTPSEYFVG